MELMMLASVWGLVNLLLFQRLEVFAYLLWSCGVPWHQQSMLVSVSRFSKKYYMGSQFDICVESGLALWIQIVWGN